nr:MAG TPA: replisome organizer protein [Caudoviricetes sp.]
MPGILIGKKPGWEAIPHCVFRSRLPHPTVHLLCNLLTHAEGFKPSYALISRQTGMSSATIAKGLKDLVKLGLVEVTKAKNEGTWQKNEYEFVAENIWQLTPELVDYALRGKLQESDGTALETKDGTALETKVDPLSKLKSKKTKLNKPDEINQHAHSANEREPQSREKVWESEFVDWYKDYPRKTGKGAARKAFLKARKAGVEVNTLKDGLERSKRSWAVENRPKDKLPYPATWLNAESWDDEETRPQDIQPQQPQQGGGMDFVDLLNESRRQETETSRGLEYPEHNWESRGELPW